MAPAHRLDRGTSGCLLLTDKPLTARTLDLAFRARLVEKQYLAVVEGSPALDRFTIEAPIGPDANSRVPGKVTVLDAGDTAVTEIEVLRRWPDRTLVRAAPRTGRRHQIRVHLAHTGHAIVGDLLHGGDERRFIRYQLGQSFELPVGVVAGRHLLHAQRLAFSDPTTGERVEVEAPVPEDMSAARTASTA